MRNTTGYQKNTKVIRSIFHLPTSCYYQGVRHSTSKITILNDAYVCVWQGYNMIDCKATDGILPVPFDSWAFSHWANYWYKSAAGTKYRDNSVFLAESL